MGIMGNGANCDILTEANVKACDVFIAVTQSDEINIISSVMAKKLEAKYSIARVRNPEYFTQMQFMSESLGIDVMLNPEAESAYCIARNLEFPTALNVETFSSNKVNIVELMVEENSYLDGLKLIDFKKNKNFKGILVCIVKRGKDIYIPTGNFVLQAKDKIYVTGIQSELSNFYKSLGHAEERIKSVIIVGGGRITYYLTSILLERKIDVKIIELNEERAKKLSETFENAIIVHGNGTDSDLLEEERFDKYDACVSLTGIDEENIIISMYASKKGIKKNITKINGISLFNVLELVGLQSIVTPKKIVADNIVKIVRSLASSQKEDNIETLYRIAVNNVEAIEFKVPEDNLVSGVPLKDLNIKKNLLIAYIMRGTQLIFPGGNDTIEAGDRVIIITTEKYLNNINKILE